MKTIVIFFIMVFAISLIVGQSQTPLAYAQDIVLKMEENERPLKIVLAGSSFIRAVNSEYISDHLKDNDISSEVYHLGVDMDLPSQRIQNLNDVIALEPDLVVYGIGYRIGINDGTHEQKYGCTVIKEADTEYSKAIQTKDMIDKIHAGMADQNKNIGENTAETKQRVLKYTAESVGYEPLSSIEVLNMRNDPRIYMCSEFLTKELAHLKEVLRTLEAKKIKTVLFVTPHPKAYLDRIEDYAEDFHLFLLQSIGIEYGVKVYDISHKYEEEDIFRDFVHVARNSKSKIYSDDISKMILNLTNEKPDYSIEKYVITADNNSLLSQWCDGEDVPIRSACGDDKKPQDVPTKSVPEWIKSNAGWWAEGQIDDETFVSGMQFLIEEKIITVNDVENTKSENNEIPPWIKSNAGWWAEGMITDDDFIKGIQHLVEKGILKV